MTKKLIAFIILSSFIFGGLGGWVLVRYVLPHLNQNSFFVRWNLLPQTAPIVITNQQVIHEDEGTDSVAAIQHSQPWVVGIVSPSTQTQGFALQGAGLILTSDGLIATTRGALGAELKSGGVSSGSVSVVFADGTVGHATVAAQDSASNLVFIKVADVSGEPIASFDEPSQLELGERVIVLSPSLDEHQAVDNLTYLSSTTENLSPNVPYSTGTIATTFGIDGATGMNGAAIVALDGNIEGLFDSSGVITSDTVKSAMSSYFADGKIEREQLGITYQYTPMSLALLSSVPSGATVVSVSQGSAAAQAGIEAGDVITKVGGTSVSLANSFESLLGNYTNDQQVPLTIVRGTSSTNTELNMVVK